MAEKLCELKKKGGGGGKYTETVLWTNPSPNANFGQTTVTLSDSMNNYTYLGLEFKYSKDSTDTMTYYMKVEDFSKQATAGSGSMQVRFGGVGSITMSRYVIKTSDTSITIGTGSQVSGTSTSSTIGIPLYIYGINELKQGTGFNETTLWTNSAPTTAATSFTCTLSDDWTNYDYIRITAKLSTTHNTTLSQMYAKDELAKCKTVSGTDSFNMGFIRYMGSGGFYLRRGGIKTNDRTQVYFGNCVQQGGTTTNSDYLIPTSITGCNLA